MAVNEYDHQYPLSNPILWNNIKYCYIAYLSPHQSLT